MVLILHHILINKMIKFSLAFIENAGKVDVLSAYRERLMFRFAIVFISIFSVLMIFNFIKGYTSLGMAIGCFLVIAILNALAIYFKKSVPIAKAAFLVGLAGVVGFAFVNLGIYGTYWTFPAVLFISISVSHRQAKIYTAIFFVYVCALSFSLLGFGLALRAVTGLLITIIFMNIFLGIIEKLQEKLVEQSLRDPLTGAFNRRQMVSSLEEAIERKHRTRTPASILIFDIDNFKSINDNYGHSVGDHVLKEFVSIVSKRARRLDQLFRIGGEEFMLFLPDTPESGAMTVAEEICSLISNADFIEDCAVTVSIGLSELQAGETVDEWMKHGDNALYLAKENGRNQVFSRTTRIISDHIDFRTDSILHPAGF